MRNVKIQGTGVYIPKHRVTAKELAKKMNASECTIKKIGMNSRYYAQENETASFMGARAAAQAVADAKLQMEEIDLLICASGTTQMPIPCTAALIHNELKLKKPIPAFDINSTCLSFLTALDTISHLIVANRYRNVLIISSEIASIGLNYNDLESAVLFGDGAAAVVISQSGDTDKSCIIAGKMKTYSEGWKHCKIPGGGTGYPPKNWVPGHDEMFQFQMNGREIFKVALQILPDLVKELCDKANITMNQIDMVIPHQASLSAMNIIQRRLMISSEQIINIVEEYGNMIAASIPFALHYAIKNQKIKRGDRLMLIGTSAGISVGGMILDY